jgi:hypothetical protein
VIELVAGAATEHLEKLVPLKLSAFGCHPKTLISTRLDIPVGEFANLGSDRNHDLLDVFDCRRQHLLPEVVVDFGLATVELPKALGFSSRRFRHLGEVFEVVVLEHERDSIRRF